MRVYLKDKKSIAYFDKKATSDFWDEHWQMDGLRRYILSCTGGGFFVSTVKKYLPRGSIVLEGGCGRGELVHALSCQGYRAIGIDFAGKTVQRIKQAVPDLDVRFGDLRNLPITSDHLDGCISAGVIEHYWEGYHGILSEMRRTLRTGGFLFLSFPCMSPLRNMKAKMRFYPVSSAQQLEYQRNTFYQFALDWRQVVQDLHDYGFYVREKWSFDGIKGFKDEVFWSKPFLQPIYDGKKYKRLRVYLDRFLNGFASHCLFLVVEKTV